jgi:hypothetical protein
MPFETESGVKLRWKSGIDLISRFELAEATTEVPDQVAHNKGEIVLRKEIVGG